jgi:uncharacterized protein YjiS (DUF1127 family)
MWQQFKAVMTHSRQWGRMHRDYGYLAEMDDHLLRDIGLHRGDARTRFLGR